MTTPNYKDVEEREDMLDSDVQRRSTGEISTGTTRTDPSIGSAEGPEARNKTIEAPKDEEKNNSQARVYDDDDMPPSSQHGPPPPHSAGFWDKTPAMANARKAYARVLGGGLFLTTLVIFSVLSIFWGSLWKLNEYIHNLDGWIVDFDGGVVGETVQQVILTNFTGLPTQMTWTVVPASQFPGGVDEVANAVAQNQVWAALTVNPGVSNSLAAATANADASYNGSLAMTAYVAEARNEYGYTELLYPSLIPPLQAASQVFAEQYAQNISSNSSINFATLLSRAPGVVTSPASFQVANIRPFDVLVATAVDFVGLIYLLIISFIICMMHFQARVVYSGLNRHLRLRSLLILRTVVPIVLYFYISLMFSLLSLAFQAPFSRYYGHAGFVIYWMINWLGMCALGLAMEAVITVLTPAFTPFFLVLWIISNVSVAEMPIDVLPKIFRYGYATPFYNVSQAVRSLLFNTRNQIGLNFGVLFAWIAVSLITIPLFTILMRKKEERALLRERAEKEKV